MSAAAEAAPSSTLRTAPALAAGIIRRGDLITLRRGERAWSNRQGKIVSLEQEQLQIRAVPQTRTCIFLGPGGDACLIYDDRPFQCRVLECWDPARFDTLLKLPPLTRLDLVGADSQIGRIIARHEERAGVLELARALEQAAAGREADREAALEAVLFDLHVREFAVRDMSAPQADLDFFFGRPPGPALPGFRLRGPGAARGRAGAGPNRKRRRRGIEGPRPESPIPVERVRST